MIRLAIVGSGGIAKTHAAAIDLLSDAELAAVCSRSETGASALADSRGAKVFHSIGDILSMDGLDGVLIATPSGVHVESIVPALRAGKHVLCEKPLEISTERISRIVDEAEKSGSVLAGFFPMRCGSGARAIKDAVSQGRFGKLTFISARVKWWRDQDYYRLSSWRGRWDLDGGGALMNQGIHAVDLLQWIGGLPVQVSAFGGNLVHPGIEVEDTLAATLQFPQGALGTIEATTSCYPGMDLSLEVSGDKGSAVLINDKIVDWRFAEERPEDASIRAGHDTGVIHGGSSDPRAISCEGHRQQIEAFCQAIRGEPADIISGREAGRAVALVEAIYRAVQSGRSEPVIIP